jgi:hypothetical protein
VKPLTQQIAWYILEAGMFVGSPACFAVAGYLLWKQVRAGRNWWLLLVAVGLACGWIGYGVLWSAFLHERRYGFDFNDATIRMKFVHWGSAWADCGMLGALFGRGRLRSLLLVGCLLAQMYWFFQVQAI